MTTPTSDDEPKMIERRTWEEFRGVGLLWWVNRVLHLFGWAICMQVDGNEVVECYPARVAFRGFAGNQEAEGFVKLGKYLSGMAGLNAAQGENGEL